MKDIKANNNKTDASFKDYFKLERQRQGMTQSDLAKNLRVSRQTVSHWENGIRIPDVSMLEAIADVLHTPVYRLLGGEEDEQEIEKKEDMEPNEIAKQLALLNSHYAEIIWEKKRKWKIVLSIIGIVLVLICTILIVRHHIYIYSSEESIKPSPLVEETIEIELSENENN